MFNRKIRSFHFFGVLGFITGTLLGVSLCYFLNLKISIILLMTLVAAGTFFLLAFVAKWITRQENIVYYHHEIAILVLCSVTLKLLHYPVLPYIDITLLGVGIFLAFGRIGCFNAGCCYGRPGSFGYHYGERHVEEGFAWYYRNVRLLPVQLIESVFVFCIVITGSVLLLNYVPPGTVLIVYTVVYGAFRFNIEFFRGDSERPYYKGLSEAQWTTLLLVAISLALSYFGTLPLYNWHIPIFIMLCTESMYIIFFKRKTNAYRLIAPRHIEEIATGLQHIKLKEQNAENINGMNVTVFTTTAGLSFSAGTRHTKNDKIIYYTLSGSQGLALDEKSIDKISTIIALINKHSGDFEIVKKNNGIYHVIFREKQFIEQLKTELFV